MLSTGQATSIEGQLDSGKPTDKKGVDGCNDWIGSMYDMGEEVQKAE